MQKQREIREKSRQHAIAIKKKHLESIKINHTTFIGTFRIKMRMIFTIAV